VLHRKNSKEEGDGDRANSRRGSQYGESRRGPSKLGGGLGRLGQFIDPPELPRPGDAVKELAVVEAVVVGRVALGVVGGRDGCHLVSVDGVTLEKELNFLGHLTPYKNIVEVNIR
jgi:hypothetical protein